MKFRLFSSSWRIVALVLALTASCTYLVNAGERDAGRFSFVVLGHVRGEKNGDMSPLLDELLVKVRKHSPDLIFLTGDMIWGDLRAVAANANVVKQDWDRLDAAVDRLRVPVYRVPGNHDIHDFVTRDVYFSRYGKLPNAFTHRGSRFILLNSAWVPEGNDPPPPDRPFGRGKQLGPEQIEFIRKELSTSDRYDHVFLFMHHLLWWHKEEAAWWRDVHPLLVGRNVRAVFGGDYGPMKFSHMRRDGIDYIQSSIEDMPSLGILREWRSSWLLAQQFDNYLHVTVDGLQVAVEVETIGAISSGKFTPERWLAVEDYEPPPMKRIWNAIGTPPRLIALTSLVLVCFIGGFVAAMTTKRHKKA